MVGNPSERNTVVSQPPPENARSAERLPLQSTNTTARHFHWLRAALTIQKNNPDDLSPASRVADNLRLGLSQLQDFSIPETKMSCDNPRIANPVASVLVTPLRQLPGLICRCSNLQPTNCPSRFFCASHDTACIKKRPERSTDPPQYCPQV